MPHEPSPLYDLLNEINVASHHVPRIAVAMAVALPDICVSLTSGDGRSDAVRYKQWCADNLGDGYFGNVTPEDLYSMRCGVLHNGRFGDLQHSVERVVFTLPGDATIVNCTAGDAFLYSVTEFCLAFTNSVYHWSEKNRENAQMVANLPRLMQYRTATIPPFFGPMKVLA